MNTLFDMLPTSACCDVADGLSVHAVFGGQNNGVAAAVHPSIPTPDVENVSFAKMRRGIAFSLHTPVSLTRTFVAHVLRVVALVKMSSIEACRSVASMQSLGRGPATVSEHKGEAVGGHVIAIKFELPVSANKRERPQQATIRIVRSDLFSKPLSKSFIGKLTRHRRSSKAMVLGCEALSRVLAPLYFTASQPHYQ